MDNLLTFSLSPVDSCCPACPGAGPAAGGGGGPPPGAPGMLCGDGTTPKRCREERGGRFNIRWDLGY